jgi:hypothetical protein
MRNLSIWVVLTFAFSVFAVNAVAQTPDGMTPAEENICDQLKVDGVSKGLYGLCVAYCEAIDGPAEIIKSVEGFEKSAKPPNSILFDLYESKRGEDDPGLPCVNYEGDCPVWSLEELHRIGTLGGTILEEIEHTGNWGELFYDREVGSGFRHYAQVLAIHKYLIGYYFSEGTDFPNDYRKQYLTEAEYNGCKQQLINHVTAP